MFIYQNKKMVDQLQKNISKKKKVLTQVGSKKDPVLKATAFNRLPKERLEKKAEPFSKRRIRTLLSRWPNDSVYDSPWINKLTNKIMIAGKKGRAEQIISRLMTDLNQICLGNPHVIFHEVVENLKPALTVVTRRVGRRYYQVPVPVKTLRQYTLALSWILSAVKENPRANVSEILTEEFISAYFFKHSEALRKKERLYQTVIKNRAFNHYRWI